MDLTDFSKGTAWSILPEIFDQLINRYSSMKVDLSKVEPTAIDRNAKGSDGKLYTIDDGVAVIPIMGPIFKRRSFFFFFIRGADFPGDRGKGYCGEHRSPGVGDFAEYRFAGGSGERDGVIIGYRI